ncbi:hypothetical protein FCV38_02920 [Clostridium sporogenes]|nr:hypothetical protein [Clostridium sporogenes]
MIKKIFSDNTKDEIDKFLSNSEQFDKEFKTLDKSNDTCILGIDLAKQEDADLSCLCYMKCNKELIEIDQLATEIKMISNKEQSKLKQFNKESLIYLKSLLLQGEDYNAALKSVSEYQENYIKTLRSLPISQDMFNLYLTLTDNNIEDAKELIMINNIKGGIV